MTTFLVPTFDKSINDTVNELIEVTSPTTLCVPDCDGDHSPAIASSGFSCADGVYVVAMLVREIGNGELLLGFTDTATKDSTTIGCAGIEGLTGTSFCCYGGHFFPGTVKYLPKKIAINAEEIISILTISNKGTTKRVQWIVDGHEGRLTDCTACFSNGYVIFPTVTLSFHDQQVEFVSFDQVKSRSPKIEELMKEFNNNKNKQQAISSSAPPSTSTAKNNALISQLRDQVARCQDAALKDRDEMIKNLLQQLKLKDQQHRTDLQVKGKQLELERAEHQKTRNLLHQLKMELKDVEIGMKDIEICYLKKEKESGQRRKRDE